MPLLLVLALLTVLAGIAMVAAGRGDPLEQEAPDRAPYGALADGDIERADVDQLRFSLAFRGYRMDEVDDVLDRLAGELADRDARIAQLEGRGAAEEGRAVADGAEQGAGSLSGHDHALGHAGTDDD